MLNLRIELRRLIIIFILDANGARKMISHCKTCVQKPYKNMPKAISIAKLEKSGLKFRISSRNKIMPLVLPKHLNRS